MTGICLAQPGVAEDIMLVGFGVVDAVLLAGFRGPRRCPTS